MTMMHLDIDLESASVTAAKTEFDLEVLIETPGVEFGLPGPQGKVGPVGPVGPPGGALLTGWWQYHESTTPPPGEGQVRSSGEGDAPIGSTSTAYMHHTDDDGLVWPDGLIQVGNTLYIRDEQGNSWQYEITTVAITVPGPDGYDTIVGTLISTTGTLGKNRRVQVNIVRPAPTGFVKIEHGSDPNVPRPPVSVVYWVGSVHPIYSDPDDLLLLKG